MIRNLVTHTAVITCDSATDNCEATISETATTENGAHVLALRVAENSRWVAVWQLGGRLLIHRCPAHADEVAQLDAVPAP